MTSNFRPTYLSRILRLCLVGVVLLAPALPGCGSGAVEERTIEVPETSALDEARQLLSSYADGGPMSSEVASFPDIVTRVREIDAEKAATLEQGFQRLQAAPHNRAAIASELLAKLQPQQ